MTRDRSRTFWRFLAAVCGLFLVVFLSLRAAAQVPPGQSVLCLVFSRNCQLKPPEEREEGDPELTQSISPSVVAAEEGAILRPVEVRIIFSLPTPGKIGGE